MIRRTNNTKSVSKPGYLVSIDPLNPDAFVYTIPGSTKAIGVCTEAVPYRKPCNIATIGDKAQVYVTGNVNKGDILRSAKSNDRASLGSCVIAKSGDSPYLRVGEALTSGKGLVSCVLDLTYQGTDDAGWVPYQGATQDVNIGDHFLTGRIIFRPGDPGIGLAPAVFMPGTLLTVPVAGTMEFDGTGLYFTNTNHRRFVALASDSIIATVTATTVAPTTLWTGVTNADELKAQRVYLIKGCGIVNNVAAASNVTVTVNFGATVVATMTTPILKLTNDPWDFEVFITVRTTGLIATGRVSAFGGMSTATVTLRTINESIAVDTTVANNITVQAVWSVANASNWLKLTQIWLQTHD